MASEYDADLVARGFVGPLALIAPMTQDVLIEARDGMAAELRRAYAAGRDAGLEAAMGVTLDRMRLHGNNRDELVKRGGSLLQAAAEHASAEACYACQERMFALKTGGE